jgi:uncharacterized protein (DUF2235 family)
MTEAPRILKSTQRQKLAVFLDGTWNNVGDDTNVWRLKSLLSPTSTDGSPQLAYYKKGVSGFLGGWVGKGLDDDITDAYLWLIDHYNPDNHDDDIFIFGFSRGAYSARSLAGFIVKCGLLKAGGALGVRQLYNRYRKADARTLRALLAARGNGTLRDATREEEWMMKYSMPINIKFVGVWDTVGELGIPLFSIQGISRSTLRFHSTELLPPVDYGFHALAINENRRAFSPTLWTVRTPSTPDPNADPPRPLSSVEQRWFVGAHANVGGGNDSDVLPQIPLRWLMKKASLHGLTFRTDVDLDGDELKADITDSYRAFMYGIYRLFSPRYFRPISAPPTQVENGTESNVNETIDASVFARWNHDMTYRPPNLADWAARHNVDIASLTSSVLADRPGEAAPD